MRIGLISDTHSYLDPAVTDHFRNCDEIWHAGDFGSMAVIGQLEAFKPLRGVYGNIDEPAIRHRFPEDLVFTCEDLTVLMTHIAGSPPSYNRRVKSLLDQHNPDILVCGHSHILVVKKDPKRNMLILNPGAAGRQGFHHMRTLLRFEITGNKIDKMEVIELGTRGNLTG